MASGQHFNLGDISVPDMQVMVETAPDGCAVRRLQPASQGSGVKCHKESRDCDDDTVTSACHVNVYTSKTFQGIDGGESKYPSSRSRLARCQTLPTPTDANGMVNMTSDNDGSSYPIHRNATPPDTCMTLNTVLFDVLERRVKVWGSNAPRPGDPPLHVFKWSGRH